jgi:hypothetical protein
MSKKQTTLDKKAHKQNLGQFMTTNYSYILQNMSIPENINKVIEPFTGNGDLLNFFDTTKYKVNCYDIEPKKDFVIKRNTINNPPSYTDAFLITNPPYLARNKSKDKSMFDKYDVNDLYKCVVKNLLTNTPLGGILIIPLNFWSSIRVADIELRKLFLEKYEIIQLNIFEETVFDDTTYTVCSFQFKLKETEGANNIQITIYPSKINITTTLSDNNNYIIGGSIYRLKTKGKYTVSRLTTKNKTKKSTNILVKCIDDNIDQKIGLSYQADDSLYIDDTPNQTARTYATLIVEPPIPMKKQLKLIEQFNTYLNEERDKYNSLFLTNYRESKDLARKRISFDLVYLIVEYLLDTM